MDVQIARERITSWRDFLVRYLLIVAGILSAWAVNQWNESRHQRRTAEQTRSALKAELVRDLTEIRHARQFDDEQLAKSTALLHALIEALQAGPAGRKSTQRILAGWDGRLLENQVTVERSSWDAAVAGQAVTTLGAGELRRFAGAYAALHLLDGIDGGAQDLANRYGQWELDRRLGASHAIELARLLVRYEGRILYERTLLRSVQETVAAALQGAASPAERGAPASAPRAG
jgi:hypothetical protein